VLPISAEPSVSILSAILPPDTSREENTFSIFLKTISPGTKVPRKYAIKKQNHSFATLKNLTISRKSEIRKRK
jgi:hypothetical protein